MPSRPNSDVPTTSPLVRSADQAIVGGLVLAALVAMAAYWFVVGGHRGELIEIDRAEPLPYQFAVDINQADWAELTALPDVGEVLARRIVESREREGLYLDHAELLRVPGIGPLTLQRIQPYLLPLPGGSDVAGGPAAEDFPVP